MALGIAPETGFVARPEEVDAPIHQAHEPDQANARAQLHERNPQIAAEAPAQPAGGGPQSIGDFRQGRRRVIEDLAQGSTGGRVAARHTSAGQLEHGGEFGFHGLTSRHLAEAEQSRGQAFELCLAEGRARARRRLTTTKHTLRQLGSEREHEQLQVLRRLYELVVLPGMEEREIPGAQRVLRRTDSEASPTPHHEVDLGLFVEVPRTAMSGLMPPHLSATPGEHGEWLIDGRIHGISLSGAAPEVEVAHPGSSKK